MPAHGSPISSSEPARQSPEPIGASATHKPSPRSSVPGAAANPFANTWGKADAPAGTVPTAEATMEPAPIIVNVWVCPAGPSAPANATKSHTVLEPPRSNDG